MGTPIRYHLEVWDAANTARVAVVGPLLDQGRRHRRLGGEETMVCRASVSDPAASALIVDGAVIRVQRTGSAADFTLWRLSERRFSEDGNVVEVMAFALWMDLAHGRVGRALHGGRTIYDFGLMDLTPLRWLSEIVLPACRSRAMTFVVGVVEATAAVESLTFKRGMGPLAGVRMLEAATRYEMQPRYSLDGRTCYVDLLARVGRAAGAELRAGKNVVVVGMREDLQVMTRLHAFGAGQLTLGDATWAVTALGGTTAARVLTFGGQALVFEDGAFVGVSGPMWFYVEGKGAYPVAASAKAAATLTVNATGLPALVVGDSGFIATSAAGQRLDYLESPAAVATYGVLLRDDLVAEDVPDARNIIPGGDVTGTYVGGLPPGWAKIGTPTTSESTDLKVAAVGGKALRVQATAADQGALSPAGAVGADPLRPYFGMRVGVTVISGQVRAEFRHSNATTYPTTKTLSASALNVPLEMKAEPLHDEALPLGTGQVAIVAHGGAAEFYIDFVMVTPQIGSEVGSFVLGQGAHLLWARAAAKLADGSAPKREVSMEVVDLHSSDPEAYPFDEIGFGDSVRPRVPRFPTDDVRIVELDTPIWGSTTPLSLALSRDARSRPEGETDAYVPEYGPARPAPAFSPPVPERAAVSELRADFDAADAKVYISAVATSLTGSLRLYTKTSRGAPWPGAATATIANRAGTFPGIQVPTGQALFYKVVALDSAGVPGDSREDSFSRVDGAPPVVVPRRSMNAAGDAADLTVGFESKTGEQVLLRFRDSESSGAPLWVAVTEVGGNPTAVARTFTPGTEESLPAQWFRDGGGGGAATARKQQTVPLVRDQVIRVHVQAEGYESALRGPWVPVVLEVKEQPWLESADLVWDEPTAKLRATVVGGAFCRSVLIEIDEDSNFASPITLDTSGHQPLTDGGASPRSVVSATPPAQGITYYLRATPYNGPLVGGVVSGSPGNAMLASDGVPPAVPPPETGAPLPLVDFTDNATNDWRTFTLSGTPGVHSTGAVQARVETVAGVLVPGKDWANVPVTFSAARVPGVWGGYHARFRDSVDTAVEAPVQILELPPSMPTEFYNPGAGGGGIGTPGPISGGPIAIANQRVTALSVADGQLRPGVRGAGDFGVGDAGVTSVARNVQTAAGQHGLAVTYARGCETIPTVIATLRKGTPPSGRFEICATDVTKTTCKLRAVNLGTQTLTARTEYFASSLNGAENPAGVAISADGAALYSSLDDANGISTTYVVTFDVDASAMGPANTLAVQVWRNDGTSSVSWTLVGQKMYWADPDPFLNETIGFDATLSAGWDIRILLDYASSPGAALAQVTGKKVDFNSVTPGTETSLASAAGDLIAAEIKEAP